MPKKVSFTAVMTFRSMAIWSAIYADVLPAVFCIYFFIMYFGAIDMEFDLFLSLPNEGLQQTIQNTVDFCEELIPSQVMVDTFGNRHTLKFIIAIIAPIILTLFTIVSDGQDFALVFGAAFSLFLVDAFKSYEVGAFYRTVSYELKEVEEELDKFIGKYDGDQMYETSIYLKKATEKWDYNVKVFMIIDYS